MEEPAIAIGVRNARDFLNALATFWRFSPLLLFSSFDWEKRAVVPFVFVERGT